MEYRTIFEDMELDQKPLLLIEKGYNLFKIDKKVTFQGIYGCICLGNGKVYIGSSENLRTRLQGHMSSLKNGNHKNPVFQRIFEKYGIDSLQWFYLEGVLNEDALLLTEQTWLDLILPFPRTGIGFNLNESAWGPRGRIRTDEEKEIRSMKMRGADNPCQVVDPDGVTHTFYSIPTFAEERGVPAHTITRLVSGEKSSTMGWSRVDHVELEPVVYELESPDGVTFKFENRTDFARDHGIDPSHLMKILKGVKKSPFGWTLPGSKEGLKVWDVRSPLGEVHSFTDITKFRKENDLPETFNEFLMGKIKSCKGWTLASQDEPLVRIVTFTKDGKDFETVNVEEFGKNNNVSAGNLSSVIKGRVKQAKGFYLKSVEFKKLSEIENKSSLYLKHIVIKK